MRKILFAFPFITVILIALTSFKKAVPPITYNSSLTEDTLHYPDEKHFKNIQQLTFGGDNAEAYFSFDGKWIIFQRTNQKEGIQCDQMFIGKVPKPGKAFEYKMVSSGKGRTTCGA